MLLDTGETAAACRREAFGRGGSCAAAAWRLKRGLVARAC